MAQEFQLDQMAIHFAKLGTALDRLTSQITAQGIGVSEKLDHASARVQKAVDDATDRMSKAVNEASEASERHARSLVRATQALVLATIALVIVTGIYVYVAATAGAG
jgi:CHASE3 domain sensor protein